MFKLLRTLLQENVSDLNDWLEAQRDCTKDQIEILKKFHSELKELKKFKSDLEHLTTFSWTITWLCGNLYPSELKIKWQEKCYFTKELIADDATNTKVLYVVNGSESKKVFAKECNLTKDVKEINGKLYLFE